MNTYSLFFKKGIKPKAVEELIDFYFHRRLAVPFVRAAAFLKLTPNQVTFLSLLTGLFSAGLFLKGYFVAGATALLTATVLDCADGMLARVTGKSSPLGRALDGLFDAVWVSFIWVNIFRSRVITIPSSVLVPIMITAGISMILHAWAYDSVKTSYLSLCEPQFSEKNLTRQEAYQSMKTSFENGSYFSSFIYAVLAFQQSFFAAKVEKPLALTTQQRQEVETKLAPVMRCWSFLGEGTHLFLMLVAGLATPFYQNAMFVCFLFILGPMNFWWVWAGSLWSVKKKSILLPST